MADKQIKVVLTMDGQQYAVEIDKATGETRKLSNETKNLKSGFSNLKSEIFSLKGAFVGLGGVMVTRNIISNIDTYGRLNGQLRLVTDSTEELVGTSAELYQIAQDTRSEYEATVQLYSRVARNTRELHLQQSILFDTTEATNKAIQIGGQTASESAAGVIQFSQALASGTLRGDEMRSVLENMPRLAQAIADGLDTDIGKLREMSEAGELTSKTIITALLSQKDKLDEEFSRLPVTVEGAMVRINNAWQRGVAEADVSVLTDELDEFRMVLESDDMQKAIGNFGESTVFALTAIAEGFETGIRLTREFGQGLAQLSVGSGGKFTDLNVEELKEMKSELESIFSQYFETDDSFKNNLNKNVIHRSLFANTKNDLEQINRLLSNLRATENNILKNDEEKKSGSLFGGDPESLANAEKINEQGEKYLLNLKRRTELLGENSEVSKLYFELEHGTLKELDEGLKAQLRIRAVLLDNKNEEIQAQKELRRQKEQDLKDEQELNEYLNQQNKAYAEASAKRLADVENYLKTERELINESYEQKLAALNDSLFLGLLTEEKYSVLRLRLEEDHYEKADELRERNLKKQEEDTEKSLKNIENAIRKYGEKTTDTLVDYFFGAKASIGDILNSIARDVAKFQIQENITNPLLSSLSSFTQGFSLSEDQLLDTISVGHTGGVLGAGEGETRNNVPASVFRGAPRFHNGRFPGLSAGELPAIIKNDEGVFTQEQMKALGGSKVNINIINNAKGVEVQTRERSGVGNTREIDVMLIDSFNRVHGQGKLDTTLSGSGANRQPRIRA